MENFAAIDFETANEQRTSVCSVGVVIVRNGEIADSYYSLIRPEPEYYTYWNTRVHGLTLADTSRSPVFPAVWQEIAPRIEGLTLVAHNKAFDESCLKAVFRMYGMDYPDYDFRCTLQASRRAIKGTARLSAAYGSGMVRLPVRATSPCAGRCRSLCLDSQADYLEYPFSAEIRNDRQCLQKKGCRRPNVLPWKGYIPSRLSLFAMFPE